MRRVPILTVIFVAAACGSSAERPGMQASSGQESSSGETTSAPSTPIDESDLRPPEILLRNSVGEEQKAVAGSFCVDYLDTASGYGTGVCGDSGAVHPDAVTVALAGDEVTFVFSEAKIVRSSGCQGADEQDCIGYVLVRPLGCEEREAKRVPLVLGPETGWTIDLQRGAYELDVFGYFETSAGATGDVSGSLGLVVGGGPKEYDALGVTAIKPAMQVCPFVD